MKSFKDYSRQTPSDGRGKSDGGAEELTKKLASAYNGKSNADMLRGILAEAEKNKRAGTLSNEEIDRFYESFAPMLDAGQRKKLRAVVERLKKI